MSVGVVHVTGSGPQVVVVGHGSWRCAVDDLLLVVCEGAGLPIVAACGGFAACNTCRVEVLVGADHLSPVVDEELPFLDAPNHRLACQAVVRGDVEVRLAPGS